MKKKETNWLIIGLLAILVIQIIKAMPLLSNLNMQATGINRTIAPVSDITNAIGSIFSGVTTLFSKNPTITKAPGSFFPTINDVQPSNILNTFKENGSSSFTTV